MQRQLFRTSSRGFAAAAAAKKPAQKAAMKIYSPAGTYAHAILNATVSRKADPRVVSTGLNSWVKTMEQNNWLQRFLEDSEYTQEDKEAKLAEHCYKPLGLDKDTEENMITRSMIEVAVEADSSALLPEIAVDFETLMLDHVKEVRCVVTSAAPLTDKQSSTIKTKLSTLIEKGESVTVDFGVDSSLIGGLTLKIGAKFQDLSVRTALVKGEAALRNL